MYEAKESPNHGHILFKDGREAFCPFQQPVPTQGLSGVGLMRMPCSTNCPMANLEIDESPLEVEDSVFSITNLKKARYVTTCGCKEQRYDILLKVTEKVL